MKRSLRFLSFALLLCISGADAQAADPVDPTSVVSSVPNGSNLRRTILFTVTAASYWGALSSSMLVQHGNYITSQAMLGNACGALWQASGVSARITAALKTRFSDDIASIPAMSFAGTANALCNSAFSYLFESNGGGTANAVYQDGQINAEWKKAVDLEQGAFNRDLALEAKLLHMMDALVAPGKSLIDAIQKSCDVPIPAENCVELLRASNRYKYDYVIELNKAVRYANAVGLHGCRINNMIDNYPTPSNASIDDGGKGRCTWGPELAKPVNYSTWWADTGG